ncbi:MAG: family 20 glycosylhydrolase [bacterium]
MPLIGNTNYNWQIVATNAYASTSGAVWTFATGDRYPGYLVPWPKSVSTRPGDFLLNAGTRIVAGNASLLRLAQVMSNDVFMAAGVRLAAVQGAAQAGDIVLSTNATLSGEAYALDVSSTNIVLSGGNYQAVAWAAVTLLQALDTSASPAKVPQMLVQDQPASPLRTVMWDIGRFFHPLENLYELVDLHRMYKVAYMHLFMSADGLFTFGTTAYPALAKTHDGTASYSGSPGFYLPPTGSRLYYTKAELTNLVQYAEDRGVVIVPEIDTPSWAAYMTDKLPATFCSAGGATQTHDININYTNAVTAMAVLMGELADVFDTSPYIHIGADEVPTSEFETYPYWAQNAALNNLASGGEALVWYLSRLNSNAVSRGKSTWAWSAPGAVGKGYDMPTNMVYTAWGYDDGQNASQGGYLVMRAAGGHVAGMGQANRNPPYNRCLLYRPAEGIYNRLTPLFRYIGAPDNIYTDLQPTFLPLTGRENKIVGAHIMEWETPYELEVPAMRLSMPALGEPTWNQDTTTVRRTWSNFLSRQARTDQLYQRVMRPVLLSVTTQVNPKDICFVAGGMVTMTSSVPGTIRFTVGTDYKNSWYNFPTNTSTVYSAPFSITQSSVISARLFDSSGKPLGNPVTRGFYLITPKTHYKYFFTGDTPAADFESGTPLVSSVMGQMDGDAPQEDVRFGDTKHRTVYSGALNAPSGGSYTFTPAYGGTITIDRTPVTNGVPVSLTAGEHLFKIVTPASGLGTPYTFSGPGYGAGSDLNLLLKTLSTAAQVFPASAAFGSQGVTDGATAKREVTIVNHNVFTNMVIASVQLTGANPGDFVLSEDSGETVLAPGAERIVAVRFDPASPGVKAAALHVVAAGLPGGAADVSLTGTAGLSTVLVTNLTDGAVLRYPLALVDGTYDGQSLQVTATPANAAVSPTTAGNRFRCLVDLQPGTNTLTISDGHGPVAVKLVYVRPTATDYRFKVWYVVPSDEAASPVDTNWYAHFGLQTKLMQSWMAEDERRAGNGRMTFYPELDASNNVSVGYLVVSQTRSQAEALGTGMFGQVWNQIPGAYKDGLHKNLAFSSVAFNALGGGDLSYVGAYTNIHPDRASDMMSALLSTKVGNDGVLTYSTYSGVTLHEIIHSIHSIWLDFSPNNIMGGAYDISQYFTLTYSVANPAPHNESGAATFGNQRDLASWNRYLMSADPHVYSNATVSVATGPEYLTATSRYPLAVFQYYIPSSAVDLHTNLFSVPVTAYSKHAGRARQELGNTPYNVMAVDTEGNMSYATFSGAPVPVVPVNDSYTVSGGVANVIAAPGVLGNDINPSGSTLTALLASNAVHGTVSLSANGGFTYTPTPGYSGTDTFWYTACDIVSSDLQARVTLNVSATAFFFDIAGEVVNPNSTIPSGYTARCIASAFFGWQTGTCSINVFNNGYAFGINSGGGNTLNYGGAISGTGSVFYVGAPPGTYHEVPIRLSGSLPNTYGGTTQIRCGYVLAAKDSGVRSVPGDVLLGDTDRAVLKIGAAGQISPDARITTSGTHPCGIEPNGHALQVGILDMHAPTFVDFRNTPASMRFADSHATAWDAAKEFQVYAWLGSAQTPLYFGSTAAGLTPAQLAQVGFQNPAGFAAGVYRAAINSAGEITPGTKVEPVNPPFDVSPSAQTARQSIYASNGRSVLSGAGSPLTANMKITFFGDSITWQNGYLSRIQTALDAGAGTSGRNIDCINRGINGGGVLSVRDGEATLNGYGGTQPIPFAQALAADQPGVAVVFIGINDVWWRNTSTNTFAGALRDLAATAQTSGVRLVLATLTVHYERPDGSNTDDPAIEVFAQLTRQAAADTGATLVDLRRVYIAYLQNNNWQLNLDGSLTYADSGILTYDGVHPTSTGNDLLADFIAQGIYDSLASSTPEVPVITTSTTNGMAPLAVTFTDPSAGTVTNRYWGFGDGTWTNASATSIVHTYTNAGVYSVTLVASGPAGVSSNTWDNLIVVYGLFANTLPYQITFEPPEMHVGDSLFVPWHLNGWYGDPTGSAYVTNQQYAWLNTSYPVPSATHSNVLAYQNALFSNLFTHVSAPPYTVVDLMNQTERLDAMPDTNTLAGVHGGVFTDAAGHLNAWCSGDQNHTNRMWLAYTNAPVSPTNWARLTVAFDYTRDKEKGLTYYSVALNGAALPVPGGMGYTCVGSRFERRPDGIWLVSANPAAKQLNSVTFNGSGRVDDMVVTTNAFAFLPPPSFYTLIGNAGLLGAVWPTVTNVPAGGDARFTITASAFCRILDVTTNDASIGWSFNNENRATNFVWPAVLAAGTLKATFTDQIASDPAHTTYAWLDAHGLATDTNAVSGSYSDTDHDGHCAWQEYVAGTDPTNPASVLKIVMLTRDGATNTVRWLSSGLAPGYSLLYSTNLGSPNNGWLIYSNNIAPTPTTNILSIPSPGPTAFYRITVTN